MRGLGIAVVLLAVSASAGIADPFASADFKFTADFPAPPQQTAPVDGEKDAAGAVISHVVTFASRNKLYSATITVDAFTRAAQINAQLTLTTERDSYLRAGRDTMTTNTPETIGGHPALHFFYENRETLTKGEGLVIVIDAPMPRIYVVIAERSGNAGSHEIAALDRFIKSFQISQ